MANPVLMSITTYGQDAELQAIEVIQFAMNMLEATTARRRVLKFMLDREGDET